MPIAIGYMDRRVSLQVATLTTLEAGGTRETWAEERKIWAQKLDKAAGEGYEADQQVATNKVDFVIHHLSNVKPATYRIVDGADIYDIQGIVEEPVSEGQFSRFRFQRLHCLLKDNN